MTLPNRKTVTNFTGMVNNKPGVQVKCNQHLGKDSDLACDYYKTISVDHRTYSVDQYCVIKDLVGIAVVKLLGIFTTPSNSVHIIVRKHLLAKYVKRHLKEIGFTEFDNNEVIEDYTREYTLNASCILRKCELIYAQEEESCVVSKNNLNPLNYYFCRYTLTSDGIFPILTIPKSVLRERNINSGVNQSSINKEESDLQDVTELTSFSDSDDENTPEKMASPKESYKNTRKSVRMSPQVSAESPLQRNTVKRNLNKSFGDSPAKNGNSILNYSIITDEEDDNSLILKLKVSEKNKIPLVLLKKCNDESYATTLKLKDAESPKPIRKSSRVKVRKSYADYISPVKSTPRKRSISENVSETENLPSSVEGTPVKSARKKTLSQINSLDTPIKSSKSIDVGSQIRSVDTPKHHDGGVSNIKSARRSLRLTSVEEIEDTSLRRNTRTTKRRNSVSPDKSDEVSSTPDKRNNLNESMRRTILKVTLKKTQTQIDEEELDKVNSKRKSRPRRQLYESVSASKTKSPSSRTIRTRSESMGSSHSEYTPTTPKSRRDDDSDRENDSDYSPSKYFAPKTPKTRNHNSPYTEKSTSKPKRLPNTPKTRRQTKDSDYDDDDYSPSEDTRNSRKRINSPHISKPKPLSTNNEEKPVPNTPKTRRITNFTDKTYSSGNRTPRTRRKATSPMLVDNTPKTPRGRSVSTPRSSVKQTPKTPKNRAKLIREGVITPSMHSRSNAVAGDSTPLMRARSQLHVSYVPTSLPCREKEYCDLFNFLEGKLSDGCGGCMYVSGVPGTGKTATVTAVVSHLQRSDDVPTFSYVSVNGMKLTEPRQSYVEILKQLTGKTVPWEQAQSMLEERFTKSKKQTSVIMVIDELDVLCTKRQDVVYNLLDWPSKAKNQLIVVTIANTMDLPERLLMSRVTSRLGLTRLTFQAYTHKQLQEIVTKRLTGTDSFNPDAIQFVARKVASVSGDARRALDICRRAAEIAEAEGKGQLVNMGHVNEALNAMITQPKVRAIKSCSRLEQLILQSVVAEVERTGVEETTFADVYKMLVSCAAIDGFKMVSSTIALSAVSRLSACRLLLTDQKCNDISQRIVLNISVDDVYYALKKD